jgi:hypothetical protein
MKHAKIFSMVVMMVVLGYGAIGFYFLPKATFQGELTRMALLPESLFGWRQPQPAIESRLLQQAKMEEADVLVIGDSFSDSRVWQTALTRQGLKVRTESWNNMRGICADFLPWLHKQGFKGTHLVLESIERNMVQDIRKSVSCQQMQYHPDPLTDAPRSPPIVSFDPAQGDYAGKLSTGIKTWLNAMEYEQYRKAADFSARELPNDVRLARVPKGCSIFSHTRCEDALFYSIDQPQDIDSTIFNDIHILNARLGELKVVWAFVPNKSTAYLYPDKRFWNEAEQRLGTPNLLHMTRHATDSKVIDLYPANNTHFSTSGYLLMGEEIIKAMRR